MLPPSPQKCVLVNLATAERMPCQFNPERLEERLEHVRYERHDPIGASFQIMHFRNTGNRLVPVSFYLDAIGTGYSIDRFRTFLFDAARVQGRDPPPLLFVWPKRLTVVARIIEVSFADEQFSTEGAVLVSTARCTLEVDELATRAQMGKAA